jgi:hypothetical protein
VASHRLGVLAEGILVRCLIDTERAYQTIVGGLDDVAVQPDETGELFLDEAQRPLRRLRPKGGLGHVKETLDDVAGHRQMLRDHINGSHRRDEGLEPAASTSSVGRWPPSGNWR